MHICDVSPVLVMERHPHQAASIIDAFRTLRAHPSCQAEMRWTYEAHSPILDEKIDVTMLDGSIDELVRLDASIAICLLRGSVGPWSVCREIDINDDVTRQIKRKLDTLSTQSHGLH